MKKLLTILAILTVGRIGYAAGNCIQQLIPPTVNTSICMDGSGQMNFTDATAGPVTLLSIGGAGTPTFSTVTILQNGAVAQPGFPSQPLQIIGNTNGYLQATIMNLSAGNNASSDFVATSNLGGDTSNYVNLGINSSGFSQASQTIVPSTWAYLYSSDHGLVIGAGANNTDSGADLVFFTSAPVTADERMRIRANGAIILTSSLTVNNAAVLGAASQAVTISSNLVVSGALLANASAGSAGAILTSQGAGLTPIWDAPSASTILSSTNTWTAGQTFVSSVTISSAASLGAAANAVTISSNLVVAGGLLLNTTGQINSLFMNNLSPGTTCLTVQGAASQSAPLQNWQNSSQVVIASMTTSGLGRLGIAGGVVYTSSFSYVYTTSATIATSYVSSNLSAQIIPKTTSSRIKITSSGMMGASGALTAECDLNISTTGAIVVGLAAKPLASSIETVAATTAVGSSNFTWIDSPGVTTPLTYTLIMRAAGTTPTCTFNTNGAAAASSLLVEDIGPQ